jgi:hypothetical protein
MAAVLPIDRLGRSLFREFKANAERKMKGPGLDSRHRDKNGEIGKKHGNTLVSTLRKIYGSTFAAGQSGTATLADVLAQLNETSLSQLVHDHKNGKLDHKITKAS